MPTVYDKPGTVVQDVALVPQPAHGIHLGPLAATTPDELLHGAVAIARPLAKCGCG